MNEQRTLEIRKRRILDLSTAATMVSLAGFASYGVLEKCIAANYRPECIVPISLWHYVKKSKVPAAKSVPVRIELQHQAS